MSMENETKLFNSEILFIYDAKMCNPNGDPDEENKPRMDYDTNKNLVSDVRLKRYIRDYLGSKGYEIWVSKVEDETVDATKRINKLAEKYYKKPNIKVDTKKPEKEFIEWLKRELIDVRYFGATMPIKGGEGKGGSLNFTGPVQFAWGYSLNPVEIVPSSSITSTFAGRGQEYGAMGKDWRVYYSLIAFYGIINRKRAEKTNLTIEDILLLDNTLIEAIPSEATTRSKLGQTPRFLFRVEYNIDTYIGDLRRFVKIITKEDKNIETLRDVDDYMLDISKLNNILKNAKEKISKIYLWRHPDFNIFESGLKDLTDEFKDKIVYLPHKSKK